MRMARGFTRTAMALSVAAFARVAAAQETDEVAKIPVDPPPAAPEPAPVPAAAEEHLGLGIEEIVVTAQKREENINEVPIAISAFSGDTLNTLGVTDTRDLSKLVPGFTAANSGFSTPVYTLRGIGFTDPSQTSSATVGVYADEFNLPYPTMSRGANVDIQRVEVLKGPQGTLYGRNTTAGLVNYVANKPTDAFEHGFSVTYGRFSVLEAEGFVSDGLTDTVKGRVAVKAAHSDDGWQVSRTRPDGPDGRMGRTKRGAARGMLDWQPTDQLKVGFTLSGWLDRSQPQAPQVVGIVPQNPFVGAAALDGQVADYPLNDFDTHDSRAADWPTEYRYSPDENIHFQLHDSFWMPTLRADWALDDADTKLTALADYKKYEADGSFLPQSGFDTVNSERFLYTDIASYAFEVRMSGKWAELARWQVGANYSHDRVNDTQKFRHETTSATFPNPIDLTTVPAIGGILASLVDGTPTFPLLGEQSGFDGNQRVSTPAVFGSIDWHLLETLTLNTGLRYTTEKRKFNGCGTSSADAHQGVGLWNVYNGVSLALGGNGMGAVPGGCVTLDSENHNSQRYYGSLDEDNVGWRLALSWQPVDGTLYYLSNSRGYKSGSFPSINISNSAQFAPVTQEKLDAYEAGAKLSLLDRSVQLNTSVFYYDYTDKQVLTTTVDQLFGPLPILANAPKSRVYGVEVEGQWTPLDGLFLSTAGTYLDTKIQEFDSLDPNGHPKDFSGRPFNFTSKWTVTGLVNYTFNATQSLEVTLGADATYTSKSNATIDGDPLYAIKSYTLVNARGSVQTKGGRWQLTLWGRNITDEYYYNNVFRGTDSVSRFTGMPATYGVTVAYRY